MPARDTAMTLEEFRQFYEKYKGSVRSAKAYDAAGSRWVEGREIFRTPGTYTLIVLQYKDKTFLRVNVKPSVEIAIAPEMYASAGTWGRLGVFLTYEEKECLQGIGGDAISPDDLVEAVLSSGFPGRETLAAKLKKAAGQLRR